MARYHISKDGAPRICTAQTAESCTAVGVDGDSAPHGDFNTPEEARRFAESVLEKSLGDGLSSTVSEREVIEDFPNPDGQRDAEREVTENFPGPGGNDSRTLEERADDLRESVKDFRDPRTSASQIEEIRQFWAANGVSNQFMASAESVRLSKEADRIKADVTVADRPAFSTDMTDSTEYRVEGGRLKAEFEGESYDLGGLREVSKDLVDEWSGEMLQEDANFQDGEVFPIYTDEGNEAGAYARFGEKYYLAGLGNDWVSLKSSETRDRTEWSIQGGDLSGRDGDERYRFTGLKPISEDELKNFRSQGYDLPEDFTDGTIAMSMRERGDIPDAFVRVNGEYYHAKMIQH